MSARSASSLMLQGMTLTRSNGGPILIRCRCQTRSRWRIGGPEDSFKTRKIARTKTKAVRTTIEHTITPPSRLLEMLFALQPTRKGSRSRSGCSFASTSLQIDRAHLENPNNARRFRSKPPDKEPRWPSPTLSKGASDRICCRGVRRSGQVMDRKANCDSNRPQTAPLDVETRRRTCGQIRDYCHSYDHRPHQTMRITQRSQHPYSRPQVLSWKSVSSTTRHRASESRLRRPRASVA